MVWIYGLIGLAFMGFFLFMGTGEDDQRLGCYVYPLFLIYVVFGAFFFVK